MEELFRSNDFVLLSFAEAMLTGEGIDVHIFDVHTSIIEGSVGVLPRRLVVPREQVAQARRILKDNGVDYEPGP